MKLVIPVDGSASAKNAIKTAIETGLLENSEIHLITVNSITDDIPASPYMALNMVDQIVSLNREKALNILDEASALIYPKYKVAVAILKEGYPAEEIIKYSSDLGADLIIMGSRGLGTFNKVLLGSVSKQVLTHSNCSVLISR